MHINMHKTRIYSSLQAFTCSVIKYEDIHTQITLLFLYRSYSPVNLIHLMLDCQLHYLEIRNIMINTTLHRFLRGVLISKGYPLAFHLTP